MYFKQSSLSKSIIFLFFLVSCQAQTPPITIYEFFGLKKGGCSITLIEEEQETIDFSETEVIESTEITSLPPISKENATAIQEVRTLLNSFKTSLEKLGSLTIDTIQKLDNGNICFLEDNQWGLQASNGTVLIPPQFDYIVVDTLAGGFVGYQGAKGNYYNGEPGKKQLQQNYFFIRPSAPESFIIQTKSGYGLLHKGAMIIPPNMWNITAIRKGTHYHYSITNKDREHSILFNDYKTRIPYESYGSPKFVADHYILENDNLIDFKNRKQLLCENGFTLKVVDEKRELLLIKKSNEKKWYLINFEGQMILQNPFTTWMNLMKQVLPMLLFHTSLLMKGVLILYVD